MATCSCDSGKKYGECRGKDGPCFSCFCESGNPVSQRCMTDPAGHGVKM